MYNALYFDYLDQVRESGEINMFLAGSWLESEFDLNKRQAKAVLLDWMKYKQQAAA